MAWNSESILLLLAWYPVFIFSTTVHEAAHALVAKLGGDRTAYEGGQVTLDPVPHIRREPFGMIIMPLLSYFASGWMLGWASTPYDPAWEARHPKRAALMSLAGPASNLFLCLFAAVAIRLGMSAGVFEAPQTLTFARITSATSPTFGMLASLLSILFSLNLLLCVFNLLPIQPLDGAGVVPLLLPDAWISRYQQLFTNPRFAFLGLIIAWQLFDPLFAPLYRVAIGALYPEMGYH